MYESLFLSLSTCLFSVFQLLLSHLSLQVERHVNPHLSLGHSATWAVSNRICSGLMSLTTQRCKPHTHLATCDTMAIRKRMLGYLHHPSSRPAMPMTTIDYRLRQRLQAFSAYEMLKSLLRVLSSLIDIGTHKRHRYI